MISISMQMPCKMPPHAPPEECPSPWGGRGEHVCRSSKPAGGQKQSGVSFTKHPPFFMPRSQPVPPRIARKPAGHVPVSHHDTLDGLHGSGPVAEDGARGKGKAGQGKQQGGMGKMWLSEQQVARREEVEEGTSADDQAPVPRPSTAALWQRPLAEGGAGVTPRWG